MSEEFTERTPGSHHTARSRFDHVVVPITDDHKRSHHLGGVWRRVLGAWTAALGDHIQRHGWADATGAAVCPPTRESTPSVERVGPSRARRAA